MNLLLLAREELGRDGTVRLRGRRAQHLLGVLNVRPGDSVRVGVERGPIGTAEVTHIDAGELRLHVTLGTETKPPPAVDLVLALPRPKALCRILQTAAAWGVRRLDLVNAWRVEKSYFSSPRLRCAALRQDLLLGCEQGGSTWLPNVAVHRLLVPFLMESLAPRLLAESPTHLLLAHPRADAYLEQVIPTPAGPGLVAAVGPEGGFIDRELRSFQDLGFAPVRIHDRILRVEAAVTALLAQLTLLERRHPAPEPQPKG